MQNVRGVWAYARQLMMVISIEQTGAGDAMHALLAAAGRRRSGGMERYFVVVDEDIDITDIDHVLWAMFTRVDPSESIHILRAPTTAIDPRLSPKKRAEGDMSMGIVLIDACKPFAWKDRYPAPIASANRTSARNGRPRLRVRARPPQARQPRRSTPSDGIPHDRGTRTAGAVAAKCRPPVQASLRPRAREGAVMPAPSPSRLIVGITGATGAPFGVRLLETLREFPEVETHLVLSAWARTTIELETPYTARQVADLADVYHKPSDQGATIASGSFLTAGMVIVPCSMKTLAGIRGGYADNLIGRAADVVLKERRRLVLVPRETPLGEIHLENMLALARMGVCILPPVPAFYNAPETIDDILDHIVVRILDQFDLTVRAARRWPGLAEVRRSGSKEGRESA